MADKDLSRCVRGDILIINAGNTLLTVDGSELDPGDQLAHSVFKGVDFKGEVRTGARSFKVKITDPVDPEMVDGRPVSARADAARNLAARIISTTDLRGHADSERDEKTIRTIEEAHRVLCDALRDSQDIREMNIAQLAKLLVDERDKLAAVAKIATREDGAEGIGLSKQIAQLEEELERRRKESNDLAETHKLLLAALLGVDDGNDGDLTGYTAMGLVNKLVSHWNKIREKLDTSNRLRKQGADEVKKAVGSVLDFTPEDLDAMTPGMAVRRLVQAFKLMKQGAPAPSLAPGTKAVFAKDQSSVEGLTVDVHGPEGGVRETLRISLGRIWMEMFGSTRPLPQHFEWEGDEWHATPRAPEDESVLVLVPAAEPFPPQQVVAFRKGKRWYSRGVNSGGTIVGSPLEQAPLVWRPLSELPKSLLNDEPHVPAVIDPERITCRRIDDLSCHIDVDGTYVLYVTKEKAADDWKVMGAPEAGLKELGFASLHDAAERLAPFIATLPRTLEDPEEG